MNRALILLPLALAAVAGSAQAQFAPQHSPLSTDWYRYPAERHIAEMDRLRAQADQREAFARQQALETRITRLEIEAARLPEPVQPPAWRAVRAPEAERAAREAATRRRHTTIVGVRQIDAWLDGPTD